MMSFHYIILGLVISLIVDRIFPIELEIKDTTATDRSASHLDLHLEIVCFVDRCLFFCTFSFGHCIVCSSSIYGF